MAFRLFSRRAARDREPDGQLAHAEARLRELIDREVEERATELQRTLARTRADSISLLVAEERRIAEESRQRVAKRERELGAELAEGLIATQKRVEQRLAGWAQDLDRTQQALGVQLARLEERQRHLMAQAEARIGASADQIEAASDEQLAAVARLRSELQRTTHDVIEAARSELEAHAAERRRALHEVAERLRQRERDLKEQVEREETEAVGRIQAAFAQIERRQVEHVERTVGREAARLAEAAALQFDAVVKAAREEAARRLSRELDRAVATFARQAETVLAERMAQVGEAGGQRFEKRLRQITAGLERHRDEFIESLERRLAETEAALREQRQALVAETEAERSVLEARLRELARGIDEAVARARERLPTLE